jgi:hypothetical protein
MADTFALTAIPWLLPEGEHKGHLEYVTFIATDSSETQKWSVTNTGTLAQDFALVVDAATAHSIVQRLCNGENRPVSRPLCSRTGAVSVRWREHRLKPRAASKLG